MALNRSNKYPGRFLAPTAARPQGAFKNRTSPTAQDGSYLEADWANDWDGFFARILTVAGVTPNGTVDSGTASQLYDALLSAMPGRLINVQVITANGTYTPITGTKRIKVRGVGGGGAGGGVGASQSTTVRGGGGGGAGTYGEKWITNVSGTVAVTIGSAGVGVNGGTGGNGGSTSFGSSLIFPGGNGGVLGVQATTAGSRSGVGGDYATSATGADISVTGMRGGDAIASTSAIVLAANGADTPLGSGASNFVALSPSQVAFSIAGYPATGYGSGGGGAGCGTGGGGNVGGNGGPGILIIEEYA